jgi:ribosome-associated protein
MTPDEIRNRIPESEFLISTSRSSGPGGQNVNKVNTKVELRFNIISSPNLSDFEKNLLFIELKNKISSEGYLITTSQSERSQLKNREKATEKMFKILSAALTQKPDRKSTTPSKKSKLERLEEKRKRSLIKKMRKDLDQL